ncbi:MAG: extracellular solute-binding protein [Clostridiales bacterium]|nr:extracellular solute-binding protein [Clostridiales bacterium]
MIRKHGSAVALVMMALFLLSACGPVPEAVNTTHSAPPAATDKAADGPTLTFRITWKGYSGRGEAIAEIVNAYNAQAGDAWRVTLVNGDEDRAAIGLLLSGQPDAVYVLPYRFVRYFGASGALLDLTEAFGDVQSLYYEAIWSLGGAGGRTYGVPWLGHSMALLYNKTLLQKAGVQAEAIRSMEDFLTAIRAVRDKTGAGGLGLVGAESNDLSWMVNQFVYGYGSTLVGEDGKTVTLNNGRTAEALRLYRDTLGPYAQPTWKDDTAVEVMDYFRRQQIAFEILGIWGVTDIEKNGSPFEVGILPLQAVGLCSEVGPLMLALPAGISEEARVSAMRFIRHMISKDAQAQILKGEYSPEHDTYYPFRTPIRIDMMDSDIFREHPEYRVFIEGFATPSVDVPVPAWQVVKDEVYAPGLHRVMTGEWSIETFLTDVEQRGNEILGGQ